jgi:hypothetical protein
MLDDDDIDDDLLLATTDTVPGHSIERVVAWSEPGQGPRTRLTGP